MHSRILRFARALLIGAVISWAGAAQAAPVTIDDFTSDQVVTANAGSAWSYMTDSSVIGNHRDLVIGIDSNTSGNNGELRSGVGGDQLSLNFDAGVTGVAAVVWDGPDATPSTVTANSFDVTGGGTNDRFELALVSTDLEQDVTLSLANNGSGSFSSYNINVPQFTTNTVYTIPFSAFAGIDFTDIGAIHLGLDPNDPSALGGDLRIDYVRAVPDPGTWALLMLGGAGAWWRRRRTSEGEDA